MSGQQSKPIGQQVRLQAASDLAQACAAAAAAQAGAAGGLACPVDARCRRPPPPCLPAARSPLTLPDVPARPALLAGVGGCGRRPGAGCRGLGRHQAEGETRCGGNPVSSWWTAAAPCPTPAMRWRELTRLRPRLLPPPCLAGLRGAQGLCGPLVWGLRPASQASNRPAQPPPSRDQPSTAPLPTPLPSPAAGWRRPGDRRPGAGPQRRHGPAGTLYLCWGWGSPRTCMPSHAPTTLPARPNPARPTPLPPLSHP